MKKFIHILIAFFSCLIIIVGLAFAFIEARLIFALDWKVYQLYLNGLLRYTLRLIIALFAIFIGVFYFIKSKKRSPKNEFIYFLSILQLFIISIFIFFLTTNYINIAILTLSTVYMILNGCSLIVNKK